MKKILTILLLLVSLSGFSQNLKGYKVTAFDTLRTNKLLQLDTSYTSDDNEFKGIGYWDDNNRTYSIALGNGVVLQVGQETLIPVQNNTGSIILDGRVLFGSAVLNDRITVELASRDGRYTALLFSTETIQIDSVGFAIEIAGRANGVNTGGLSLGPIYVDSLGLVTNTQPEFPDYSYPIGAVVRVGVSDGIIQFRSDGANFFNSIRDAFDGSIRETFDLRTFSDGVTVKAVLNRSDSADNATLVFSNGWFDFALPDTIDLTAGTSTALQDNYLYIDKETRTFQLATSFPFAEHAKVAFVSLLDAATTQTYGAMINQNFNDHFKYTDDNGHILHIAARLRTLDAKWESGVAPTLSGTPADLQFQTTAGKVWHLHLQDMPVKDMSTGDVAWVVNDPSQAYFPTDNMNYITEYSDGSTWNNQWSNIVLWGGVNKTGEISQILINLPSDGYNSEANAIEDESNFTNYTIPRNFRGKGFLIGRFTIRRSGATFTYNPSVGFLDLRGFVPNTTAGGGAGGSTPVTEWTQLNDIPASYLNFAGAFATINLAETGVEFILRENMPLTDLDSTGFTLTQSQIIGLDDTLSDHRTDINTALDLDLDDVLTNGNTSSLGATFGNEVIISTTGKNNDFTVTSPTGFQSTMELTADGGSTTMQFLSSPSLSRITTPIALALRSGGNIDFKKIDNSNLFVIDQSGNITATGNAIFDAATLVTEGVILSQLEDASLDVDFNSIEINGSPITNSYISNVTEASNNITFTGVGSAFNGSIGSIAKTDVANTFSAAQTFSSSGTSLNLRSTSSSSPFVQFQINTSTNAGDITAVSSALLQVTNATEVRLNTGGKTLKVRDDGIFADLDAASASDVVYHNPITGEMTYGAAPTGTVSFGAENQIPSTNSTTDDFDYSSNLTFDGTTLDVFVVQADAMKISAENPLLQFLDDSGDDFDLGAVNNNALRLSENTTGDLVQFFGTGALEFSQYGSGTFTGTAAYNLEVDASGDVIETTAGSDFRMKENFRTLNNSLDKILSIETYAFDWKKDIPKKAENEPFDIKVTNDFKDRESAGVIAQEIIDIIPESVKQYNNGYYSVDYEVIVPHLIEAIKAQQKQIDVLKLLIDKK